MPLLDNLLLFGRVLRRAGIDAHPQRMIDVVEALGHVNIAARDEVYHACRALLVHRPEEIPVFDRAFDAFWRDWSAAKAGDSDRTDDSRERVRPVAEDRHGILAPVEAEQAEVDTDEKPLKTWSDQATIGRKDFAALTPQEVTEARAALARLAWNPGERRTRRWIAGRGRRLDLRRAIRDSVRTDGDVVEIRRRMRKVRTRPLVLLCDVSGSMERYTRMLLYFAHALAVRHRRVEAFLFSTELTRITRQLHLPKADAAIAAVSRSVRDWSGGTRIGASIREFHQRWSRRALTGGAVVLLISDGWDRGDPNELRDQIARLQRSCHRLVWLNPLIGTTDYAPLTRGLRAALPYVDDFLPARTLRNLADLAAHLNNLA